MNTDNREILDSLDDLEAEGFAPELLVPLRDLMNHESMLNSNVEQSQDGFEQMMQEFAGIQNKLFEDEAMQELIAKELSDEELERLMDAPEMREMTLLLTELQSLEESIAQQSEMFEQALGESADKLGDLMSGTAEEPSK